MAVTATPQIETLVWEEPPVVGDGWDDLPLLALTVTISAFPLVLASLLPWCRTDRPQMLHVRQIPMLRAAP